MKICVAIPLSAIKVPVNPYDWNMSSTRGVIANPPKLNPAAANPNAKLLRLSK